MKIVTGERAFTSAGGFNPSWQRHVSAYRLAAGLLPEGQILDIGCGIGHSYVELGPTRPTIGVDLSPEALRGQQRPCVIADLRVLPFADRSADGLFSAHSIEHVPDPERGVAEFARVLASSGTAVVVTPNRLTFGKPEEIIDPYHFIEFDPEQLRSVCATGFNDVTIYGIVGSTRYQEIVAEEHRTLDRLLAIDRFKLRQRLPRSTMQKLYDVGLTVARRRSDDRRQQITADDFSLNGNDLDRADDLMAVCRSPK